MKRYAWAIVLATVLMGCGRSSNTKSGMSKEALAEYQSTLECVQTIERQIEGANSLHMSAEQAIQLYNMAQELYYTYDPMGMDSASQMACRMLEERVNKLRPRLLEIVNSNNASIVTDLALEQDKLLESAYTLPVYLMRGDSLLINITTERAATLSVFNADARTTVFTQNGKTQYSKRLAIQNSAIYLIEVNPGAKAQYVNMHVSFNSPTIEQMQHDTHVTSETVEAQKGEWRSTTVKGVQMRNLFEEPRKFTLRGQLKAAFSGSARALVAIQVPAGASDILYSLRISTNEADVYSDGSFAESMDVSYRKVRFLGLPLYESQRGSGLLSTLLGENQPPREEDAYINMYVFYDASQARKFQDGVPASELKYNVDYTTLGTQSCNGRIPAKGNKTIYLAFENERIRYNNYVWLEAVSAVPTTEYFKEKYTK